MRKYLTRKKVIKYMGTIIAVLIGIMVLIPGHTDSIVDSNGSVIPESISIEV